MTSTLSLLEAQYKIWDVHYYVNHLVSVVSQRLVE